MVVPPMRPEPRGAYETVGEAARIEGRRINTLVAILVLLAIVGGMLVLAFFFSH